MAVILAVAALAGCAKGQAPQQGKPPVSVTRAERRSVPWEIAATGIVEPLQTVQVTAQVGGLLTSVHFNEGDEVRENQVLFEIDARPYVAARQQAEASLSRDLAQFANAEREAERSRELAAGGLGTTEDAQQKSSARDALAATLRADSATLAVARLNLEYCTVRAPIGGRTGSLLVKAGNLIRANAAQPLVTINELHPILIRFAVPATRLAEVQERRGAALAVRAVAGGRADATPVQGVLSFVDNHVDSTTGTVMLKARFANIENSLWPGQFAEVTLVLGVQHDATVVPAAAVMTGQQGPYVFTVEPDGTAKQRMVTVARSTDSVSVIAAGVDPGMTVVIDGQLRLTSGAPVEIKNDRTTTGSMGASAPAPAAAPERRTP